MYLQEGIAVGEFLHGFCMVETKVNPNSWQSLLDCSRLFVDKWKFPLRSHAKPSFVSIVMEGILP